jgi:hypothetical protein
VDRIVVDEEVLASLIDAAAEQLTDDLTEAYLPGLQAAHEGADVDARLDV